MVKKILIVLIVWFQGGCSESTLKLGFLVESFGAEAGDYKVDFWKKNNVGWNDFIIEGSLLVRNEDLVARIIKESTILKIEKVFLPSNSILFPHLSKYVLYEYLPRGDPWSEVFMFVVINDRVYFRYSKY